MPAAVLPVDPPLGRDGQRSMWDQRRWVLSMIEPLPAFGVRAIDAVGRTLNESILAEEPIDGCGIAVGDVLVPAGVPITPRLVALLAASGIDKVMARPSPRVVVLGLTAAAEAASAVITAEMTLIGAQPHRLAPKLAASADLVTTISEQLVRSDLIVTVGGLGDTAIDLRAVADQIGPNDFAPIAVNPGRDQGFALAGEDGVPWLALPADANAAFVLTQLLALPIVRRLMGTADPTDQLRVGHLTRAAKTTPRVATCVPGAVHDDAIIVLGRMEGAAGLYRAYQANALVVLDSADGLTTSQTEVRYLPL